MPAKKWSQDVTKHSNAMDLEPDVFKLRSAKKIAESLKRSVESSHRLKGSPYQSAMSMLNFYINRAGKNLPESRLHVLENAKKRLRKIFGREEPKASSPESARGEWRPKRKAPRKH